MKQKAADSATTGVDSLGKALRRNLSPGRFFLLAKRGASTFRNRGWEALCREIGFRFALACHGEVWRYRADIPLKRELKAQRNAFSPNMPLISVVVPLYNTPSLYLSQMIKSVTNQSYPNFELVLADGSDTGHPASELAAKFGEKDSRIKYFALENNTGISGNTNAGFAQSTGDYLLLLDHDDVLSANALFEVATAAVKYKADLIYSDEVVLSANLKHLWEFHFKPDFSPDTLRGCNYITHLCAFSKTLLETIGGKEQEEFDGAQDYDLILRLTEKAKTIYHIPKVLYYWRRHENSTANDIGQKPQAIEAGAAALQAHLNRTKLEGLALPLEDHPGAYRVHYKVWGIPVISILIPSKDHIDDLSRCLSSLYEKAGWLHFEVLVLENNSTDPKTESYYAEAEETYENLQVLRYSGGFNFAAICNFGAARAKGEHLLFLNNDIEIQTEGFLQEMLSYSQRPDVGAVGAMLYYPDDTVQHAGLFIGIGGTAGVSHKGHEWGNGGDMYRLATTQNMSAVTGAALMIKKALYEEMDGMDENRFAVAFNDVDLCLRLREKGYWNVFTPFAQALHYESKSRGYDDEGPSKYRYEGEAAAFKDRHKAILENGDPFYNPHLTLKFENYGYR